MKGTGIKALIVEDDDDKLEALAQFLDDLRIDFDVARSHRGAQEAIRRDGYSLCLMDMSIPTYDRTDVDDGYSPLTLGGSSLMREMKRRGISIPTVVITQFSHFGETIEDQMTFDELSAKLKSDFSDFFLGAIYYVGGTNENWHTDLSFIVKSVLKL